MHRSSSYYLSSTSSSSSLPPSATAGASSTSGPSGTAGAALDVDQLPTYDPRSDAAKKEALDASRADLARTLVHLVPVVVLLCGLLLWSLSATDVSEVGVLVDKGSAHKTVTRVKLMTYKSESSSRWNGSNMMTGTEHSVPTDKSTGIKRRELRSEM
ncbi:hypothetical protein EJB05_16426 [Eragrostis curvula]|uniref:Uncharacterized protein n=1 Tax=Eragrostis curvula TaxID=38414 RepID=A0A5J9VEM8_9POAL|nr:hypothetical protein EJB05_16426 [Eragrostis curvula]